MRGKLIVFDGNDGSGKRTQAEMLQQYLVVEGKEALLLSFPRYETFFGRELKKALSGEYGDFISLDPHLASILYATDRWAAKDQILGALDDGHYVICDRYASANQIHQGGKIADEMERAEFLIWLDQLEYGEFRIPRPDISIYLDVPPAVSHALMIKKVRDVAENNPQYFENSHLSAQWLIAREPDRWIHACCSQRGLMRSREEIHQEVIVSLQTRRIL